MASELTPGQLEALFARMTVQAVDRSRRALEALAIAVETQAKINANGGSHKYGTRSPASPGSGPAIVSGALRRSITHTPIAPAGGGWATAVGMAAGVYPPHPPYPVPGQGKRRRKSGGGGKATPVSKYAEFLETGLKNGNRYPFLEPAFRFGVTIAAPTIYSTVFGAPWGQA